MTDTTPGTTAKKVKKVVDTTIPPIAKYGLLMGRNKYIRLDNVQTLINSHRHFIIYKWQKYTASFHEIYAYLPWISYASGKFSPIKNYKVVKEVHAMKPMHIWFKGDQELRDWLGDEIFSLLVADLM